MSVVNNDKGEEFGFGEYKEKVGGSNRLGFAGGQSRVKRLKNGFKGGGKEI